MKDQLTEEKILKLMGHDINTLKMWVATSMTNSEREYWRELRDKYNRYVETNDSIYTREYKFMIKGFKLNMWQKYKDNCPAELLDNVPQQKELSWEEIG